MFFRLTFFLLLLPSLLHAQQTLLILHKGGNSLGFYDPDSGRQHTVVAVGLKPHEFVVTPDHRLAYVTDYGVDSYTDKSQGGNTISIVDLVTRKKAGIIDLKQFHRPHGIVMDRRGKLVVTCDFPAAILTVDPERREVIQNVEIGQSLPHMVALSADGEKAYSANSGSGTVSVIDLPKGKLTKNLQIGGEPQGFAVSPDGRRVFATNRSGNAVVVIDTTKDEVVGRIQIPGQPVRLHLTADGRLLLVSLIESGEVAVVDTESLREIRRFAVGLRPEGINIDPLGGWGYVSAGGEDKVIKFSVDTWKPVLQIKTGAKPDPMVLLESENDRP
jgi:YVTN family beta-propeller protein